MRCTNRVAPTLIGAAILAAVSSALGPIATADPSPSINVPVAHVEGRGHGHGVGMSQWGAFTMGRDGASAADIISTFYPGTQLGTAGGEIVVGIQDGDRVTVQLPEGGEIRASRDGSAPPPGFPVRVAPGESVELVVDSSGYQVLGGTVTPLSSSATRYATSSATPSSCLVELLCPKDTEPDEPQPEPDQPDQPNQPDGDNGGGDDGGPSGPTTAPAPTPTTTTEAGPPRSSTPLWAVPAAGGTVRSGDRARTYRGLFEFTGSAGSSRLRNHVDVEHYVAGMAEVPGNWPPAAVQAQAIAARTFALRAMAISGEICDTASCQVYTGVSHESAGQRAAVEATRGQVVTHGGGLASTFYSASGGGHSATPAEGFGGGAPVPYLPAKAYETDNPKQWSVDIALTDIASRLGYPGTIEDIRVDETGPSGRALAMTITGDSGDRAVDPQEFRRRLGLQSTLFTVTSSEAEEPPPPPDPGDDRGVVGTSASPDEDPDDGGSTIRRRVPTHTATETAMVATPSPVDTSPPLALVGVAAAMIAASCAAGILLVGSRQRLHPIFALGSTVTDLSMGAARRRIRAGGRRIATLSAWTRHRR